MALSTRAQEQAKASQGMLIWKVIKDLWDPEKNPSGYLSLGVAENALMHDTLQKYLYEKAFVAATSFPSEGFTYGDGGKGTRRLQTAMARFLTRHLKPFLPIKPADVMITNGCSPAIEHLSWAVCNRGDGFLLGQPHYGAFIPDIELRPEVHVLQVAFGDIDPVSLAAVQKYEEKILEAQTKGQRVGGLMLCHPHNPLGRCYPRDALVAFMKLCQKYQIHLVSDEIYALSVWENKEDKNPPSVPFESILSINPEGIIDPSLVHVIWGISKDFGANGLRLGAIVSHNTEFHDAMVAVSIYSYASSLAEHATANILEDDAFVDAYVKENRRKLSENYSLTVKWARQYNIEYKPGANAAFFLWVNLGKKFLEARPGANTENLDGTITQALLDKRVFLASGQNFGSELPGWFRIVFSQPKHMLEEGLRRIEMAMDAKGDMNMDKLKISS